MLVDAHVQVLGIGRHVGDPLGSFVVRDHGGGVAPLPDLVPKEGLYRGYRDDDGSGGGYSRNTFGLSYASEMLEVSVMVVHASDSCHVCNCSCSTEIAVDLCFPEWEHLWFQTDLYWYEEERDVLPTPPTLTPVCVPPRSVMLQYDMHLAFPGCPPTVTRDRGYLRQKKSIKKESTIITSNVWPVYTYICKIALKN